MNAIDKMFEYNLWANTQLIGLCTGLDAAQLEVEVQGAFGRIQPTLAHLVNAEGYYVRRLAGSHPWGEDVDIWQLSIAALLEKAQQSGAQLIELASQVDPAIAHDVDLGDRSVRFYNWTVLLQALYHGIEHRTQVKILLTQLGVEHPELAAWDYTEQLAIVAQTPKK